MMLRRATLRLPRLPRLLRNLSAAARADDGARSHFPHLLSPLPLGAAGTLPNRVVMGSMHTGLEDFGVIRGNPLTGRGGLSDLAEFFAERARGGVGLIVTGGVAPNRQGKVSPLAGKMSNGLEARAHREVTTLCMMRAPAKSSCRSCTLASTATTGGTSHRLP